MQLDLWELGRAGDTFKKELREQGEAICSCCGRMAKVYKRTITSSMAQSLIRLHKMSDCFDPKPYVHIRNITLGDSRLAADFAKLRYWSLITEKEKDPEQTETRTSGLWQITPRGIAFVRGEIPVSRYAVVYEGRCLGFEGETAWKIRDALGERFNYEELMRR